MDEIFVKLASRSVEIARLQNTAPPLANRLYGSEKRKIENEMFDTRIAVQVTSIENRDNRYD